MTFLEVPVAKPISPEFKIVWMVLIEFGFGILVGLVIILIIFRSSDPKKEQLS